MRGHRPLRRPLAAGHSPQEPPRSARQRRLLVDGPGSQLSRRIWASRRATAHDVVGGMHSTSPPGIGDPMPRGSGDPRAARPRTAAPRAAPLGRSSPAKPRPGGATDSRARARPRPLTRGALSADRSGGPGRHQHTRRALPLRGPPPRQENGERRRRATAPGRHLPQRSSERRSPHNVDHATSQPRNPIMERPRREPTPPSRTQ